MTTFAPKTDLKFATKEEWRIKLSAQIREQAKSIEISSKALTEVKSQIGEALSYLYPTQAGDLGKLISSYVTSNNRKLKPVLSSELIVDLLQFEAELQKNGDPKATKFSENVYRAALARAQLPGGDINEAEKSLKLQSKEIAFIGKFGKLRGTS